MNPNLEGADLPQVFYVSERLVLGWQYLTLAVAVGLLGWTIYRAVAKRDPLPVLMFIGGLLLALSDPMYNSIFHIRYAENFSAAFTGFGIATPAFMPVAYAGFGVVGYFVYRSLLKGVTTRKLLGIWGAIFLVVVAFEGIASGLGLLTFDGQQPFEIAGYGAYLAWLNAIGFMSIGALLLFMVPRLRGWQKAFLVLVPALGHLSMVFNVGWPLMIGLNWEVSPVVAWLLGAMSLALSLIFVWAIGALAQGGRNIASERLRDEAAPVNNKSGTTSLRN